MQRNYRLGFYGAKTRFSTIKKESNILQAFFFKRNIFDLSVVREIQWGVSSRTSESFPSQNMLSVSANPSKKNA